MARLAARQRFSFAKLREVMPLPDLVAVQRDSFKWFLEEGIAETLTDISPIEDFTGSLKLELADLPLFPRLAILDPESTRTLLAIFCSTLVCSVLEGAPAPATTLSGLPGRPSSFCVASSPPREPRWRRPPR